MREEEREREKEGERGWGGDRERSVKECSYDEYVCALARRSVGRSMNISKQSIITTHFGQCFRKSMGRVFLNTSRDGQTIRHFKRTNKTSRMLENIRQTVDL